MAFYKLGDSFKWFIARVIDIKDPEMIGRLKIRVIHEQTGELGKKQGPYGVTNDDLLWAYPISAIQSASLNHRKIKEIEKFDVPPWIEAVGLSPTGIAMGTYVYGFYLDGPEQNIPLVFGTYHKMSRFPEPGDTDKLLQDTDSASGGLFPDVAELAREKQTLPKEYVTNSFGLAVDEPETAYAAVYPYNLTYTTKSGHAFEIDDTPSNERIHFWHKTGSYEEINKDGRRVEKTVDSKWTIVQKDDAVHIQGNHHKEVDKNVAVTIGKDGDIIIHGDLTIQVDGNADWHVNGFLDITSDTQITMVAPRIDLNP